MDYNYDVGDRIEIFGIDGTIVLMSHQGARDSVLLRVTEGVMRDRGWSMGNNHIISSLELINIGEEEGSRYLWVSKRHPAIIISRKVYSLRDQISRDLLKG